MTSNKNTDTAEVTNLEEKTLNEHKSNVDVVQTDLEKLQIFSQKCLELLPNGTNGFYSFFDTTCA